MSVAIALLCLSATYSIVVEVWSAYVLYVDDSGASVVVGLVMGILAFYAIYCWLIYRTWQGGSAARIVLLVIIVVGITVHLSLAWGKTGELFGPPAIVMFLDSLRVIALVLLLMAPRRDSELG